MTGTSIAMARIAREDAAVITPLVRFGAMLRLHNLLGGRLADRSLFRRVPPADRGGGGARLGRVKPGRTLLVLHDQLGGIWEVTSGANRPEPLPTELNRRL